MQICPIFAGPVTIVNYFGHISMPAAMHVATVATVASYEAICFFIFSTRIISVFLYNLGADTMK